MTNELQELLECEICFNAETEYYIVCGNKHSFCFNCSMKFEISCPKCRQTLRTVIRPHRQRNNRIKELLKEFTTQIRKEMPTDVDAMDCDERWCRAKIIDENAGMFLVQYYGWGDRWNEWIPICSGKIMPIGTHTENWIEKIQVGSKVEFLLSKKIRRWHVGTIVHIYPSRKSVIVAEKNSTKKIKVRLDNEHLSAPGTHIHLFYF